MTRQLLGIVVAVALVAGAVMAINHLRNQLDEESKPAASVEAPAPPIVRETPPPAETAKPKPAPKAPPAPKPRAVRRAPAPKPAAEPPPAPTPAPPPAVAVLRIDSDVPGAQVFIDRQYIGVTPVTAPDVSLGTHTLNVTAEGYDGFAETIDVSSGRRDILVKFREVRLAARIGVVHKHRLGSCRGELIATPQGIRYETSDDDDDFSESLLALDKFDIDYRKKNLKVKVKEGREYNFTDPEGDADRLLVFHRDVHKARARLEKGDAPATE